MNERIKRILEQADISMSMTEFSGCLEGQDYLVADSNLSEMQLEKFAELIVRECMSVARGMRNPSNLNYKPSDRFVDELRLHFGVEE
jgi:hypothetical protein